VIAFAASLIPPWARWVALAAAALALFVAGERFGAGRVQARWDARDLAQARENMRVQELRDARHRSIEDAKDRDLRDINTRLADALERLRNRPERLPEAGRAACAGATGAELGPSFQDEMRRFLSGSLPEPTPSAASSAPASSASAPQR
jgi:hypothetical protein